MKIIKIGTHDSELALWQVNSVKRQLEVLGYEIQLVPIKSTGDLVLNKPLDKLGITSVFTRDFDLALLNNEIDIAVHSLNDVPTILPEGIVQAAVLKRGNTNDMLVFKDNEEFMSLENAVVATSSSRRKAQWLHRFPTHTIVDLQGDVNTRLQKLKEHEDWNGAIFTAAGLNRIGLTPEDSVNLNWMIPAPAQGAIMICALKENTNAYEAAAKLNDEESEICTTVERDFLNALEGDSMVPIAALAFIKDEKVFFKGALFSRDGKQKIEVSKVSKLDEAHTIAKYCAGTILQKGGKRIMLDDIEIRNTPKKNTVISTKKLSALQTELFNEDIAVDDSDFIKIRFNRIPPPEVKDEIENVIITSKNAVESLAISFSKEELQFKNIYFVGSKRTKRLIEKQIGKVAHSEKSIKNLTKYLFKNLKKGAEVTYFCSDIHLNELPTLFAENDIVLHEIQAYKMINSAVKVAENTGGVLFYSPSAIQSYLLENDVDKVAFCIGETTAVEAKKNFKKVKVAKLPTVKSLIELVNVYYAKK